MTQDEAWLLREKYNGEKTERFLTDSARLEAGEPLAYVIGHMPFLNTTIFLDSHPLIPRTETEFWVEEVIGEIANKGPTFVKVLDLCAGSGCIGVSVLKAIPTAHVDFCEIDVRHHATITKNILENGIDISQTNILSGDLFENVTERYDFILTNPPYIDPALDRTQPSVKEFEPTLALYGGTDGMEAISQIITEVPQFLKEDGALIIEHEPEQSTVISTKAHSMGFGADTHPDQFGIDRCTKIARK